MGGDEAVEGGGEVASLVSLESWCDSPSKLLNNQHYEGDDQLRERFAYLKGFFEDVDGAGVAVRDEECESSGPLEIEGPSPLLLPLPLALREYIPGGPKAVGAPRLLDLTLALSFSRSEVLTLLVSCHPP